MATTFLEIRNQADFRPCRIADPEFRILEATIKQWEFNRFLYEFVGEPWEWRDKRTWADGQWRGYVENDNLKTCIAYQNGSLAGYFELQAQANADVEIVYFGLAPHFIGRGYGGPLLSAALERAWAWGARRIWLHTCSLDHPAALGNYLARGFKIYRVIDENI